MKITLKEVIGEIEKRVYGLGEVGIDLYLYDEKNKKEERWQRN